MGRRDPTFQIQVLGETLASSPVDAPKLTAVTLPLRSTARFRYYARERVQSNRPTNKMAPELLRVSRQLPRPSAVALPSVARLPLPCAATALRNSLPAFKGPKTDERTLEPPCFGRRSLRSVSRRSVDSARCQWPATLGSHLRRFTVLAGVLKLHLTFTDGDGTIHCRNRRNGIKTKNDRRYRRIAATRNPMRSGGMQQLIVKP